MPIALTSAHDPAPRTLDQLRVSGLTRRAALVRESFDIGPLTELIQSIRILDGQVPFDLENVEPTAHRSDLQRLQIDLEREKRLLTIEDANIQAKPFGLQYDKPVTQEELDVNIEDARKRILRQSIIASAEPGFIGKTLDFAMGFLGQAVDPINIAVSFIPIVGPARAAIIANRLRMIKVSSRTVKGFIEGAVGNALIEPIVIAGENIRNRDYELSNSALNVLFGGFIGVAAHQTIGRGLEAISARSVISDARIRATSELRIELDTIDLEPVLINERILDILDKENPSIAARLRKPTNSDRVDIGMKPITHETATRSMLAQKLEGKLGDVEPILERDPGFHRPFDTPEAKAVAEPETVGDVRQHAETLVRAMDDPANTTGASAEAAADIRIKAKEPEIDTVETVTSDNERLDIELEAATNRMREAGGEEAVANFERSPVEGQLDEPSAVTEITVKRHLDEAKAAVAKNRSITDGIMRVVRECFGD
ncbi:hypothetical protein LCGC14_1053720 [marine sediment metagenome]|uniref:Uncharacterized protein n=1 Tax=marine sediment metagenome TaxID=412755 RepID=A0A0F9MN15_9ZZZZ